MFTFGKKLINILLMDGNLHETEIQLVCLGPKHVPWQISMDKKLR